MIYANYDWDDNIIYMPTKIVLFKKSTADQNLPQEVSVSTETFAHTRSKVGVESHVLNTVVVDNVVIDCPKNQTPTGSINLVDYEADNNDGGSFRQFRDCSMKYFLRDLKTALDNKNFGASFKDFVEHCETKELANNVTIITARGHSPETIHEGLVFLQKNGYIKFVPPVENIYPCSYKHHKSILVASAQNPSEAKKNIILSILDQVHKNSNQDKNFHTFGFSDDDAKTMKLVEQSLSEEIAKGRWNNFEINLYFTGNKVKERKTLLSVKSVEKVA